MWWNILLDFEFCVTVKFLCLVVVSVVVVVAG